MIKVAIVLPGQLPVPAVLGGAIETLVNGLIEQHEKNSSDIKFTVISKFNKEAALKSKPFKKTSFKWVRNNFFIKLVNFFLSKTAELFKYNYYNLSIYQILLLLKLGRFDIILIEGNYQQIEPISKLFANKVILFHLHAKLFNDTNDYNNCNKVISISKFMTNQLLSYTNISKNKIVELNNAINLEKFSFSNNLAHRSVMRKKFNLTDDDIVISYVGRIVEEKGLKELILALNELDKKGVRFKLIIIGSTFTNFGSANLPSDYLNEINKLSTHISNHIIQTGYIHNDEIPKFLSACDISAIPSMYEEPQGLVLLEAMAAGLPIVTTDSGGIPEIAITEFSIIVKRDINFINNYANAILDLIINKNKRVVMGKNATLNIIKYDYSNFYMNFTSIIQKSIE